MSQHKATIRSQPQQASLDASKYPPKARQLQELFPTWSIDDLGTLLNELNGDLELAATRISDGAAVPWGEVSRKRDKKPPMSTHASKPSPGRGDSRGARGGRGGRGGSGRGGPVTRARGHPKAAANGHMSHNGPHPSTSGTLNDVSSVSSVSIDSSKANFTEATAKTASESHEQANGIVATALDVSDPSLQVNRIISSTSLSATRGHAPETPNGSAITHANASRQASKTPATSKLSWAQVARPQEKPASLPLPSTAEIQFPSTSQATIPAPTSEVRIDTERIGWEEPTTVEAPIWEEPKQSINVETWPPTEASRDELRAEVSTPASDELPDIQEAPPVPESTGEASERRQETTPSPLPIDAPQTPSSLPSQVISTPSPKLTTRPVFSSHRTGARHKIPDQPVTLPLSFGTGIEMVGMQFGSLSVGDSPSQSSNRIEAEASVTDPATQQIKAETVTPATTSAASSSLTSVFQQPQHPSAPQLQQIQPQTAHSSVPHHAFPTSVSQPIASGQITAHNTSPLQQFAQQQTPQQPPPLSSNVAQQSNHHQHHLQHHLPHLPQQLQQSQAVPPYNPHGVPIHLEASQQTQTPIQQQALQTAAHSTFFRGADATTNAPYFHAATPVTQPQDSSYGSFGQLSAQGQHQQGSHLGAFGSSEYGYSDTTRGFYDSYGQQQGFASRNPLGHDDVKGLQGGQQSTPSTVPLSTTQGAQAQSSNPQPTGGSQGPQQTYPLPVPYYYSHPFPQNQYYGAPYSSGYVPQPFVKYPVFQQGPPGPGTASNPTTKQPGGNVGAQPQTNPYNQTLYQQGYDDYQSHHTQHQPSHNIALGQGVGDYSKQLYGGASQSGMQGFMGLGGQTGVGGTVPVSNTTHRGGASPETPYKSYTSKDVGVTGGRNVPGQNQGQVPSQALGHGNHGHGFYSGNRFGGATNAPISGGPQQGGPQSHLSYPQGNEPGFYGYQPRQQQGYWQ